MSIWRQWRCIKKKYNVENHYIATKFDKLNECTTKLMENELIVMAHEKNENLRTIHQLLIEITANQNEFHFKLWH